MDLREYANPAEFLQRVSSFLEEHEAENNLMLGIAARMAGGHSGPLPFLATLEEDSQIVAAAVRTPPNRLILSRAPAMAIAILADYLARRRHELPGIVGPVETTGLFTTAWRKLSRQSIRPGRSLRIFQLDRVIPPPTPGGSFVEAAQEHFDLLVDWVRAFNIDAGETIPSDNRRFVEAALAEHRLHLWKDGQPVSLAACSGPTPHGVRINLVYTPPPLRNRGYASAAVAALSQELLDSGRRFCFLFTDLANPTSNSIYRKIGYHPVCDFREYLFT
jgi:uncharacterized protein